jgi:predicted deacetylase
MTREAEDAWSSPEPRIVVIFRNDDPSACSDVEHERRVADIFERKGVPQTIGVVPFHASDEPHDPRGTEHRELGENPAMVDFLRAYVARSGSEVALHGYTHRTNRLSRPSRREYFEFRRLSAEAQAEMIRRGTEIVERALGVRPTTFIPPWNRLDQATLQACAQEGYRIVSAGSFTEPAEGLVALGTGRGVSALPGLLAGTTGPHRVVLMVLYHSSTTRTAEEMAALERAVHAAVNHPGCETLTLTEAVRRYPDDVRLANEAARNAVPQHEVLGSPRARATVYRRVFAKLGAGKRLERLYEEAQALNEGGHYRAVCALSPRIEQECRRIILVGHAVVAGVGGLVGVALCAVMASLPAIQGVIAHSVVGGLILALGALVRWHMTSEDSKREVWAATLTTSLAVLASSGLCGLVTGVSRWLSQP